MAIEIAVFIQNNPPIDMGIGIHDNFRIYKLSLIFFDFLLDLNKKEMVAGLGLPFAHAIVLGIRYVELKL